eukprot:scaffold157315_cov24-Attheya_sp.AAC.1
MRVETGASSLPRSKLLMNCSFTSRDGIVTVGSYTDTTASAGYHGAANQAVQRPTTPISSVASPTDAMDAKIDTIQ